MLKKRGSKGFNVISLPYETKIYTNNQVLLPARLVRKLRLKSITKARITIEYKGKIATFEARLISMRKTDSRQFTIPKDIREGLNLDPASTIKIVNIEKAIA